MRFEIFFAIFILIGFVSAIEIDFDCPREVYAGEEFCCDLEIDDCDGDYDVKVELLDGDETIAEIFDGDDWQSAYYYLKEFIEDEEEICLVIDSDFSGKIEGMVKLRQGSSVTTEDFNLKVLEAEKVVEEVTEKVEESFVESVSENVVDDSARVINLDSSEDVELREEIVFESRDEKVREYSIYAFSAFLIFVIVVLLWKNG